MPQVNASDAIRRGLLTAIGDMIYASAVSTPARLAAVAAGQVLTSQGVGVAPAYAAVPGFPTVVRKTADEIVNNSAALQNDDHLLLAVGANEIWEFTVIPICASTSAADIKFAFTAPAGGIIRGFLTGISTTDAAYLSEFIQGTVRSIKGSGVADNFVFVIFRGIIINGVTAGNFQVQWAQNVAEVSDATVFANSCIIAHKLA